jgi:hypothetical protein
MYVNSRFATWLFIASFVLIFYGMGASFVESFVNYPTWRLIGPGEFLAYHHAIGPLVIGYMVVPMLVGTFLTALRLVFRPARVTSRALWLSIALQGLVWISTATVQVPIQLQLGENGLSLPLIDRLIVTNFWFRKIPQIINAGVFLWMISRLIPATPSAKIPVTQTVDPVP